MNESKRQKLIARMGKLEKYNGGVAAIVMPLVGLEEYYDGAEGEAQLLGNSPVEPTDDEAFAVLKKIRSRQDVEGVYIALVQCDDGEWPYSDKILVISSSEPDTIIEALPEGFGPDEAWEGDSENLPAEPVPVPSGYRKIWLWYD